MSSIPLTSKWNPAPPLHYHMYTTPHYLWVPLACEGDVVQSRHTRSQLLHYTSTHALLLTTSFPTPYFTLFSFFFSLSHISLNLVFFKKLLSQYSRSSSHNEAQSSQLLQIQFSRFKFCSLLSLFPIFSLLIHPLFFFFFFIPSFNPIPHKVNASSLFELQQQTKNQKPIYLRFLELMGRKKNNSEWKREQRRNGFSLIYQLLVF